MNYTKPDVYTLGDAGAVIEIINPAKPYTYFLRRHLEAPQMHAGVRPG
jgi:hypothetical protein